MHGDLSIFVALVAVGYIEWGEACIAGEKLFGCALCEAFGVKCVNLLIASGWPKICIGVFPGLRTVERCRCGYRYYLWCPGRTPQIISVSIKEYTPTGWGCIP